MKINYSINITVTKFAVENVFSIFLEDLILPNILLVHLDKIIRFKSWKHFVKTPINIDNGCSV